MNYLIVKFITNIIVLPLILMLFWNLTMPDLFGLKEMSFFQAIMIKIMSNILFKNNDFDKNINIKSEEEKIAKDIAKFEELSEKYKERLNKKIENAEKDDE